ncbi:uncharacterized protein LOC116309105 [Actinia tenebrosa]|uniref:Uncharacterized protein LOC116298107 n=1 Tax=Actinia tenebrosa TaxID=6105 RepID=A0A6P8JH51_ACTTE|nr:uncharacterized protein LOC116298107 [Actinia tenebrosa]XP_031575520.1 uncharacterized protein LOC116309105 [Actinia tenebrosa]
MKAFPSLVLLFCLVGLGTSEAVTASPTPNPECPGMHRIAKNLEKGVQLYTRETTICSVNNACTGLMCNGTHKKNDFYMKMELNHCKTPPSINLDMIYVNHIKYHGELKPGNTKVSSGGLMPIELKLTLKKNRNRITAGLDVQLCTVGIHVCKTVAELLPPTTFCLNMKTCAGYNSTGDIPCHINPTGNPASSTHTSSDAEHHQGTPQGNGSLSTTKNSSPNTRPRTHSPTHHSESHKTVSTKVVPTKGFSSTLRSSTKAPTQSPIHTSRSSIKPSKKYSGPTTALPGGAHPMKRESGHSHISAGVAVGIAFACVVGVLIIVGAAIYWKKFYRRSRLRAAYYNDISMNDPLYEDFGPEVA